jgi:N-acyl-L-homoserine lactone synthetase
MLIELLLGEADLSAQCGNTRVIAVETLRKERVFRRLIERTQK